MKKTLFRMGVAAGFIALSSCNAPKENHEWLKNALDRSVVQLNNMADALGENEAHRMPRSFIRCVDSTYVMEQKEDSAFIRLIHYKLPKWENDGKMHMGSIYDWTSGFYPGSMWYGYELTKNDRLKTHALKYTAMLEPIQFYDDNHDIGFMINCSYGNQERLLPAKATEAIIVQTAETLMQRFDPTIGAIRSWDFGPWNYPVIIDNMMNLDLLFNATRITGDNKYKELAFKHADTTLKNHFRNDFSSYHVISYNNDGSIEQKCTFQGKNDESAWARGQAWGLYGYAACYRESKDERYKKQVEGIANLIMTRVKNEDFIPYWDWDGIDAPSTPRDASAAAITASALFEWSTLVSDGQKYFDYAEKIIRSLSSDAYLAKAGENQNFILMHSTGSLPHGSEIDVPLNYADYYYLEAIQRYMKLKGLTYETL